MNDQTVTTKTYATIVFTLLIALALNQLSGEEQEGVGEQKEGGGQWGWYKLLK